MWTGGIILHKGLWILGCELVTLPAFDICSTRLAI